MFLTIEDGLKIYYEDYGDSNALTLLFIHGWGVSSSLWSEQVSFFVNKGYRVITFDSRGHGRSDNGDAIKNKPLSEFLISDIQKLVSHLNIKKPYGLIGHSAGGAVAISLYFKNPQDILFICLINSSYTLYERIDEKVFWHLFPEMIKLGLNPIIKESYKHILKRAIPFIANVLDKPKSKVEMWVNDIINVRIDTLFEELKHLKKHDIRNRLSKIQVPCLIIAGEYDLLTPPIKSKTLHKLIPNSELHIISHVGHLSIIEKSDEVNRIILDFIKKIENKEFQTNEK
ncbi:MAG: alpha/beta fold hydrolase [Candidatus Helarchaeota archaeon]